MPKSKRASVVSLTKTGKKTKEQKSQLIEQIHALSHAFAYVWTFHIDHMRNQYIQHVRTQWKGSRILLGRNGVMRKALGNDHQDEHRPGLHLIAQALSGDTGLLFTNEPPNVVTEWFESYKMADYARTGNVATESVHLPAGPIKIDDDVASHTLEPQFRKLGMVTTLKRGVPTLDQPHTICNQGDTLNPNQVNLLKLFHKPLATFQIRPSQCLDLNTGTII